MKFTEDLYRFDIKISYTSSKIMLSHVKGYHNDETYFFSDF